jgi:hypothetical protein
MFKPEFTGVGRVMLAINLSCLGLLSDRILRRYVAPEEPARVALERRQRV